MARDHSDRQPARLHAFPGGRRLACPQQCVARERAAQLRAVPGRDRIEDQRWSRPTRCTVPSIPRMAEGSALDCRRRMNGTRAGTSVQSLGKRLAIKTSQSKGDMGHLPFQTVRLLLSVGADPTSETSEAKRLAMWPRHTATTW